MQTACMPTLECDDPPSHRSFIFKNSGMLKKYIYRPVLSTVISIIIILLGSLGMANLQVAQYPDNSHPSVQVSATYTAANVQVTINTTLIPSEHDANGKAGISYL